MCEEIEKFRTVSVVVGQKVFRTLFLTECPVYWLSKMQKVVIFNSCYVITMC